MGVSARVRLGVNVLIEYSIMLNDINTSADYMKAKHQTKPSTSRVI